MPHGRLKKSPSRKQKIRGDYVQQKEDQWHSSVSQCAIHKDSLCNVSGYEMNAHSRGSLPELVCCDGKGGVNGWLYKEVPNNASVASSFKREELRSLPQASEIKMEMDDNYINLGDLESLHLVMKKNNNKEAKPFSKKGTDSDCNRRKGISCISAEEVDTSRSSYCKNIEYSESRNLRLQRFLAEVDDPTNTPEPPNDELDDILHQLQLFIQSNKLESISQDQRAELIDYLTILSDEYDKKMKIGDIKYELKDQDKNIASP